MSVIFSITIAVKGNKSDIKDLYERLEASRTGGNVPFDSTTVHLARMMDYEYIAEAELKSPTQVEFSLLYEGRVPLDKILWHLTSAYEDIEVAMYFISDSDVAPLPIVYDSNREFFNFSEPAFYLDEDFDIYDDEIPWDEYDEWRENLPDEDEVEIDESADDVDIILGPLAQKWVKENND